MRFGDLQKQFSKGGLTEFSARLPISAAPTGLPVAGDGLVAADLQIEGGRIASIGPGDPTLPAPIVWPCPVDCHTHIDKGQVWARTKNETGDFIGALDGAGLDRATYPGLDDMIRRAAFSLRAAYAHGTCAIRSHVDAGEDFEVRFSALKTLAEDWAGRVDVQLAPFTGVEEPQDRVEDVARVARSAKSGVLSAFLYNCEGLNGFLDQCFQLADRYGLALDFHADERLDPSSDCTRRVAETALRHGFQGPVLIGHACALSVQPADIRGQTFDLLAEAGIGIVSLPLCNSYLMDRGAGTPRQRGFAPVHEMRARGIPVALASDNARDPFHAYGDMDLVELFRDAMRLMHLDHPVGDWPASILTTAADVIGLAGRGRLSVGAPADLILFSARNWSEFAARPQTDRIVLRNGRVIDTTPPDFADLDHLEGMTP